MTIHKPTLPWRRLVIVVGLIFGSMESVESTMTTTMFPSIQRTVPSSSPTLPILLQSLRGGATSTSSSSSVSSGTSALSSKNKTKKKKSKKQSKPVTEDDEDVSTTTTSTATDADAEDAVPSSPATTKSSSSKSKISKAMKEKDAAEALGDAIRDRADILRSEDPLLQAIDWSVGSLGQALGTSDQIRREGGGVEAAPSSVIAQYFLKSHGGAHLIQSAFSLLSTLAGLGALTLYSSGAPQSIGLTYSLLHRTFLFAMLKHVSGLIAGASIAAQAIPKIGLGQSRQWMERLATDPVSQYVFFNALLMVWLPPKHRVVAGACWWWKKNTVVLPLMMLGPILLREVISNIWVISDVLVLWSVGSGGSQGIETILKISNSVVNALMSVLVTPGIWRSADPAQKQAILSKVVSKVSLVLEVGIGVLMVLDTLLGILGSAFLSGAKRPPFRENLTRMICVRLYIHFLWIRRAKIKQVAFQMRGGASKLPFYVLDALYQPAKAMGIERPKPASTNVDEWPWYDKLAVGMGLMD